MWKGIDVSDNQGVIDWKKINPILCVAYRIWLSIARFKLGWSYDRQLENKQ